ncbi:MAG: hypothetical protein KF762_17285 [Acidobacteria bacterium]|nr:hypothetical protein [Acidobacteriota bacterium]
MYQSNFFLVLRGVSVICLMIAISPFAIVNGESDAKQVELVKGSERFSGAWELIEIKVTIKTPSTREYKFSQAEWKGLWLFEGGRFSKTFMKINRKNPDLCADREFGFVSSAGTFKILEDNRVIFRNSLTLSPLDEDRPQTAKFVFDGDHLTLLFDVRASVENLREGTEQIVLRRATSDLSITASYSGPE